MKIFQFAILASAVRGDGKVSKKRCEQDLMEENMKYCEDHNTSLSGCVDWIKEGPTFGNFISPKIVHTVCHIPGNSSA